MDQIIEFTSIRYIDEIWLRAITHHQKIKYMVGNSAFAIDIFPNQKKISAWYLEKFSQKIRCMILSAENSTQSAGEILDYNLGNRSSKPRKKYSR